MSGAKTGETHAKSAGDKSTAAHLAKPITHTTQSAHQAFLLIKPRGGPNM